MLKKQIDKLIKRYGLWRLIHISLAVVVILLVCVCVLEFAIPIGQDIVGSELSSNVHISADINSPEIFQPKAENSGEIAGVIRPNLFKAAGGLSDRPMADKTIEKIKSSLKLQCIMEMDGKPTAYINIDGVGLKKCTAGDTVENLFTVLNINERSVEISIVEHKVTLGL